MHYIHRQIGFHSLMVNGYGAECLWCGLLNNITKILYASVDLSLGSDAHNSQR